MKRNIFIVITVLLCFILQSTGFRWLAFGGIAPNLLVIITATFGFMCGQKCGLWVGFFSGLLYDIFFGNVLFLHYLMHVIVPEIIYTVLVTLILYPLIRMINGKLDGTEKRSEDGFA